jgi:hypothetical protein
MARAAARTRSTGLAHKRADANHWSVSDRAQKRHLVVLLKEMIARLEADMEAEPARPAAKAAAKAGALPRPHRPSARATGRLAA